MPLRPTPYTPRPYVRDVRTMGDILGRRGASRARGERERGNISGQLYANLGSQISNAITGYYQQRADEPVRAAEIRRMDAGTATSEAQASLAQQRAAREARAEQRATRTEETERQISANLQIVMESEKPTAIDFVKAARDPERGMQIANGWRAYTQPPSDVLENETAKAEYMKAVLIGFDQLPEGDKPEYYRGIREQWVASGVIGEDDAPEEYIPDWVTMKMGFGEEPADETAPGRPVAVQTQDVEGRPVTRFVDPEAGAEYLKPDPASSVSDEDITITAQMLVDRRAYLGQFPKRGQVFDRRVAEAHRLSMEQTGKPYDPAESQLEYIAAQRFVGAMNAPQMVRFRGLATAVVNTIDEVGILADKLKQGGVQKFNSLKRNTILAAYGNTAQSGAAAQYMGALLTLQEEFANLAQGGYAPTESAWELAQEQINADFGVKDMHASLDEVQKLINFRILAFDEQQPYQLGQRGGSGGTVRMRAPDGSEMDVAADQVEHYRGLGAEVIR